MTQKHFIALAAHIKANRDVYKDVHIQQLADFCEAGNPKFKRSLFIEACGGVA